MLRRPVAVLTAYAGLLAGGVCALTRLPLDLAPAVEYPALSVGTPWPGVSAETVEMLVTAPIEETAGTVEGVRSVSSNSSEGHSQVDIEFEQQTRMDFARLELYEKLAALSRTFPAGAGQPAVEAFVPEDFRNLQGFLRYSLVGNRPAADLRTLGRDILSPRLRRISGVADVQVEGGEEHELQIELEPGAMASLGLQLGTVTSALEAMECSASAGTRHQGAHRTLLSVRTAGLTLDLIARTPVAKTRSGAPVLLRDIGTIRVAAAEPQSYVRVNGKPSVTLVISKEPHVSALQVADRVFDLMDELRAGLPPGFELVLESDKSGTMRSELAALVRDAGFSLICIVLVLALFLGNAKAPILVLSSICFSLAGTCLAFWLFGVGLHVLSLAGLVLGFGRLVDDSIVVLDNLQRRADVGTPGRGVSQAVGEVALPVMASTMTTVGALVPTSLLPANLRPYFVDFSLAVGISLVMSLVVSFTLMPVVASRMQLVPHLQQLYARAGSLGAAVYGWCLRKAIARRLVLVPAVLWMFGLPVWLLPDHVDGESMPAMVYNALVGSRMYRSARPYVNWLLGGSSHLFFTRVEKGEVWAYGRETYLVVRVAFPQGTDLQRYDEIARRVEAEALSFGDQVEKVTCEVLPHSALVRIEVPRSLAETAVPFSIKNRLTVFAARTGEASIGVWGFGPGFSSGEDNAPTFAVRVLGYNYGRVKEIAETFRQRLEVNPRIADVDIDRSWSSERGKATELVARVNRQEASRLGANIADVVNTIRASIPGAVESNRVTIDGERLSTVVKVAGYRDRGADDLRDAVVTGTGGSGIRLAAILTVSEQKTPGEILREDQSYVRWVTFEYRGPYRYGTAFVDETIRSINVPHGYRFDRSFSWYTFSDADKRTMLLIAAVAFTMVFMVTASLYESFRKPFLVILSVPFSLIGLFLSFVLAGAPFGRGGYAAVILLIGIVTTNSIVLVDKLSHACPGRTVRVEELVGAALSRVRPVLMTTLTTMGGLLPMLLLGDRSSIWYSLALGTIGGLASSMVLTLIVVPVGYLSMAGGARKTGD